MSKPALRVYGTLFGVPRPMFEALKDRFGFDLETWNDDKYELEYEGNWCDVDGLAEALPDVITPETEGKIDAIDQHDWTLTRIAVKAGQITIKTISCDDPLERYRQE
ncbi:hypothetical protein [Megalodesulfovibrio paquesii]